LGRRDEGAHQGNRRATTTPNHGPCEVRRKAAHIEGNVRFAALVGLASRPAGDRRKGTTSEAGHAPHRRRSCPGACATRRGVR
jgi:hypothetical protein